MPSANYPADRCAGSRSPARFACRLNPFTYAVKLIRFALYAKRNLMSLAVVTVMTILFAAGAIIAYDPA
jgi:ABC-2 type transport system permease protein